MSAAGVSAAGAVMDQYQHTTKSGGKEELGKNEFLELLVAQLNNQNPLEPQNNGDFIAQLAQFSTVEGVERLNGSMENILSGYQSSQALQASSLVGRTVIVPTDTAQVETSADFNASMVLPQSSSNVFVNVYDAKGSLVTRINMGEQQAGQVKFSWDGTNSDDETMPPGSYKFEAQASVEGENKGLYTLLPANVDSVTLGQGKGGEPILNLAGIGAVPLSQVHMIGQ